MRLIGVLIVFSVSIMASFFPKSVTTRIASIDTNGIIRLEHPLPASGMSGLIVHTFQNLHAGTGYLVQIDDSGHAKLIQKNILHHDTLPSIKTSPQKGDTVLGGYLYDNVMALVPDAATYDKVVSTYPEKIWFHPDLLAAFLSEKSEGIPTPELLRHFALRYQIGLFYIVKRNETVLYDPISQQVVARKKENMHVKSPKIPFFTRFTKFRTGIFSDSDEINKDYYDIMERFQ